MLSDKARRIGDGLRSLAPRWVRTGARTIDLGEMDGLWPGERCAVAEAVSVRQAEFATGRALLRQLIGADLEIPVGVNGRPMLPLGVAGTLAHDHDVAVAATSTRSSCRALGVDIEPLTMLTHDEAMLILRPEERHLDAHLVFVLKEAVYKAWSSLGGDLIGHNDVVVDVDESGRNFTAVVRSVSIRFAGRYLAVEGRHLSLVVVEGA